MATVKTYDQRCYNLAETFLSDVGLNQTPKAEQYRRDLAAHIQLKIEEWIVDVVNVNELQSSADAFYDHYANEDHMGQGG